MQLPTPGVSYADRERFRRAATNALRNNLAAEYGDKCVRIKHNGGIYVKINGSWKFIGYRDDLIDNKQTADEARAAITKAAGE